MKQKHLPDAVHEHIQKTLQWHGIDLHRVWKAEDEKARNVQKSLVLTMSRYGMGRGIIRWYLRVPLERYEAIIREYRPGKVRA